MERRSSWLLLGSLLEVACAEGLSAGRDPIDHTDTDTEMDDDTSDEGVGDDSSEDTGTGEDSSGSSDSDSSGSGDDSDSTDDTGGSSGDGSDSGSSDGDSSDGDSSEGGSSDSGDDSGGDSTEDDGSTSDSGGSETDGGSSEDGSGTEGGSEADDASSEDGSDGEGSDSGSTDGTGTDTECDPGFADCDEEPGCETDVSGGDLDHCGTCDKSCNLAGASEASCMAGTCTVRFVVPITGDSYTNSADTGENNGDYQAVWVDGGPDVFTAYLQAAMPTVPDGATVSEGNLITMCYEGGGDVTARRILAVWDEATITAANAPSVDMANALDTQTPAGSFGAPDPVIFDVAAAIQQWLDGAANHGVALFGSGTDGSSHHSSEASSASNRPEYDFTVTY